MTAENGEPHRRLLAELRRRVDEVLGGLIDVGARCALLDFPNYPNVGDNAIWLGQIRWLERRRCPIVYTCEPETYSRVQLRARLGTDGIILLTGGGNLGDLWPHHQSFRETVIRTFPNTRIVQLPQSVCFRDPARLAQAATVFDAHPNLTLLVRDRQSLARARSAFRAESLLCPDMAFGLDALDGIEPPSVDVLWLARNDQEAAPAPAEPLLDGVRRIDWPGEPWTGLRMCHRALTRTPAVRRALQPLLGRTYERLARARLRRGLGVLSQGRVMVTDRLHGHILSMLVGRPHVLMADRYGKVRAFYETWTSGSNLAHWGGSAEDALSKARSLLPC